MTEVIKKLKELNRELSKMPDSFIEEMYNFWLEETDRSSVHEATDSDLQEFITWATEIPN